MHLFVVFYLVKLDNLHEGVDAFNDALELAVSLSDAAAQTAITKALSDLQKKLSQGNWDISNIYKFP